MRMKYFVKLICLILIFNSSSAQYNSLKIPDTLSGTTFNAEYTPQAFIIWKENNKWVAKYSGAIDDNGKHPEKATSYIANTVDELLNNKPVSNPKTQSFGCKIFYRK